MSTRLALVAGLVLLTALPSAAQPFDPALYAPLKWRCIGPYRGGRTVGATGVPGQPNLFYIGVNNGGVWKTTDAGRVWVPIFDNQPTGSIGALAVAPSNPNVIYVGSGEGLQRPDLSTGDGVYVSRDGGKTWTNTGLRDGQQISAVIVEPKDENRAFVAVLGHPYGANAERGVFRTTDGGRTWAKVLYKDENTGAVALAFDPSDAKTVYAVLWAARQGPWENGAWQGPGSGLFRSTDGGTTWKPLTKGLPTTAEGLGRIGLDVSRSDPKRLFAVVDCPRLGGLYRSDDAGDTWQRVNEDRRLWGRGSDFAEVKIDPKNKDVLYVANIGLYKSTDGGVSFTCFKGAPGGDDYHTVWISPDDSNILLVAADQGAIVTVNGGETWSSWYNQPTAQFYHVITDNQFPYWVYGGQQESGSAGVASRGNDGQITAHDWHTVGVEEYGYVAPDPLNPDIIFGGKVQKYDRRTGQVQDVAPEAARGGTYRFLRTAPLVFSTVDKKALYLGANVLFKTTTGGHSWDVISPDLTRPAPEVPESIGVYRTPAMAKQPRRGVLYAVAPSYTNKSTIWAGTDDGLIHVTRNDGKTWAEVTPPGLTAWSKVSVIDAGRFDDDTAYAAINRIRLDDHKPYIYRTHDGGKTWKLIVRGLPEDPVNTVREDPVRKGLLFAGTERAVYVSFNDGDDWQALRQNMPATSIRDLVIHEADVVVGTHGRSFWILDNISPLRQLTAATVASDVVLFAPANAYQVKRNVATDTPLPPDEPTSPNPPDGAVIDYHLKVAATGPVTLEILDPKSKIVRRFTSTDPTVPVDPKTLEIDPRWVRPPHPLPIGAGSHRFVWDLHYPPPEGAGRGGYPISAIYGDTPPGSTGPAVMPGTYTVRLTVGGKAYEKPLVIKMDPRITTPVEGLEQRFTLSMQCYDGMKEIRTTLTRIRAVRKQLDDVRANAGTLSAMIDAVDAKIAAIEGPGMGRQRGGMPQQREASLGRVAAEWGRLLGVLQGADATPTTQATAAVTTARKELGDLLSRWAVVCEKDLADLNAKLKSANLPVIDPSGK